MMARLLEAVFASLAVVAVACGTSESGPSTFAASSAESCAPALEQPLPATPPPGTIIRAITLHVTNDSGQSRWVQTGADDGCAIFDLVRGGAPFRIAPPQACGCDCKAPEPRTSYTRLVPGESVDLPWNGVVYQLVSTCVTGEAFGCEKGVAQEILTAIGSAALASHYDGLLHVESVEPPGCTAAPGSPVFTCGAEGAVPGRCAHGTGEARFDLVLASADAAPESIPVSLK